ncbi:hypothetical protein LVJ85_02810 [Neisseria sp. Dent CA1/247]|uniref:hypothetical protein n=1 Tax=Neisseria sp. Dent CA1/247 TaxID=2912675 RepID=UPI001FD2AFF3|nr:hypothetical protein [Neisseria sp. Dent CA1/247]UOO77438.1 hypothetical protein LVJ85_02810 [Neisseria sp. Dent CA1/247]
MKIKKILLFFIFFSYSSFIHANEYFCLKNPMSSNFLMVSSDFSHVMYAPYNKKIKLSKLIKKSVLDSSDEESKPFYSLTYKEIINNKVTGEYVFNIQGYLIYSGSYKKNKKRKDINYFLVTREEQNLPDKCI